MTLDEYHEAFMISSISDFHDGYEDTGHVVKNDKTSKAVFFEIATEGVFYVSVSWPSARLVKPCKMKDPKVTLGIAQIANLSHASQAEAPSFGINAATAEIKAGPGKYVASAVVHFPDADYIEEVTILVYASDSNLNLVPTTKGDSGDTLLAMFGPTVEGHHCDVVMIKDHGLFKKKSDKIVLGIPTYWRHDDEKFAYYRIRYKKWYIASAKYFSKVQGGSLYKSATLTKEDFTCGCEDAEKIGGFSRLTCADVAPKPKYPNVKCSGAKDSDRAQRFCPKTCSKETKDVCTENLEFAPGEPGGEGCEDGGGSWLKSKLLPCWLFWKMWFCHPPDWIPRWNWIVNLESFMEANCCMTCVVYDLK